MALPAYRAQVYQSNGPARMSSLALQRGAIEADTTLRRGAAVAGGIQQVGEIAGQTMRVLAQEAENKPKRELERAQVADATKTLGKKQKFEELQTMLVDMSPDEAIEATRQAGFPAEADKMRSTLFAHRKAAIDNEHENLKMVAERLEMAGGLLASATALTDPQAQAAQYQAVLPKVRSMVGAELAGALPDTFDPQAVNQALTWGMTAKDAIATRAALAKSVAEASEAKLKSTEFWQETGAKWLATATDAGDWTDGLLKLKAVGGEAAMDAIAMFGKDFTPEAVARVKSFVAPVQRPATAPQPGSEADFVIRRAGELGVAPESMTTQQIAKALREHASAGWKPEKDSSSTPKAMSAEQFALIERWRVSELRAVDAAARTAASNGTPMSPEEVAKAKADVQQSVLTQIRGLQPEKPTGSMKDLGKEGWKMPPAAPARGPEYVGAPTGNASSKPVTVQVNGKTKMFPNQAALDAFLKATGMTVK